MPTVAGSVATVTVAAPAGSVSANANLTVVSASVASQFRGYQSVTASSATMEFVGGKPVQLGLTTLASDRWFQMYPG